MTTNKHLGLMRHVMIDFETLSTNPNAAVLSLGAVLFTKAGLTGDEFYVNIDGDDCIKLGLHVSQSTVDWWAKQSQQAKDALETDKQTLLESMTRFSAWVRQANGFMVWGNGADFDNPILKSCYEALGADAPFKPYNGRCYRTIKSLPRAPKMKNALAHIITL